jgi:hypothetical protein
LARGMGPGKTIRLTGLTPEIAATSGGVARSASVGGRARRRIFLLSPANAAGPRAQMILREAATFPLAVQLREQGLPLGEIFSFISGLYFRGKLAYARAHASPPSGVPGIVVITASGGLVSPDRLFRLPDLREITTGDIAAGEPAYRVPLIRDAQLLREHMGAECEVVLLGSVATPKYVEPLLEIFGERLMFPVEFVGRGDMSRGGLMLRYAREMRELTYVPVVGALRHGTRPPKLPKLARLTAELADDSDQQVAASTAKAKIAGEAKRSSGRKRGASGAKRHRTVKERRKP